MGERPMTTPDVKPVWEQRVDRSVRWALRNWLLFANSLALIYGGLPWLSPLARANGNELLGRLIFWIYSPLCHQLPERAFFVYGYQVAYCHRDVAIYTTLFAGGVLFGLVGKWIKPAPWWFALALSLPILIDGGSHMLDDLLPAVIRGGGDAIGTVNFWLRIITGVLFAFAVLIAVYPRLNRDLRVAQTTAV
jgi:uncharacterized membrane protein